MAKTRRKLSVRSICGVLLVSIGVVLATVTIVHMATFNPEKVVTMKAPGSEQAVFSYTAPGVLNMVNDHPHIRVTASAGDSIQWGIGSSADVQAFVGQSAAREMKGFKNEELQTLYVDHEAAGKAGENDKKVIEDGGFALDESDMWEKSGHGKGSVDIDAKIQAGVNRSFIVTTNSGKAPEVTITWKDIQEQASPAPFIVIGVLLVLIGVVLLLTDWREQARRAALGRARDARHAHAEAETSILPLLKKGEISSDADDAASSAVQEKEQGTDHEGAAKNHENEPQKRDHADSEALGDLAEPGDAAPAHGRRSRRARHKYREDDATKPAENDQENAAAHHAQTLWGYTEESENTEEADDHHQSDDHPENYLNVSSQKGESNA